MFQEFKSGLKKIMFETVIQAIACFVSFILVS